MHKTLGLPLLVLLCAIGVFLCVLIVTLARADLWGMVPFIPVGIGGIYVIVKWFQNRAILKRERRRSQDLDDELRYLIDKYRQ